MADLVKELRASYDPNDAVPMQVCLDAADRIEKLEAGELEFDRVIGAYASENARFRDRIEKLEAALREIEILEVDPRCSGQMWVETLKEIARAALGEKKDD